jgi:tetratricopeptide (TPR) repeat protein
MSKSSRQVGAVVLFVLAAAAVAFGVYVWRTTSRLPAPGSATYESAATAYYRALAALEVGLLEDALAGFEQTTALVPEEPAGWANIGVVRLRLGELDAAAEPIAKAVSLAPDNGELALLSARFETARGQIDQGITQFRRAVQLLPDSLQARFALAEELERTGNPDDEAESLRLLDDLVGRAPSNLAILIERARLAAKREDVERLRDSVSRLEGPSRTWPAQAAEQYAGLAAAAAGSEFAQAARSTALLRNVLARVPDYSASLVAVRTPAEVVAEPLDRFVLLAPPPASPAPPDTGITFTAQPLDAGAVAALTTFSLDGAAPPVTFVTDGAVIRRPGADGSWPFPGGAAGGAPTLLALDWNNDFRVDLFAAGSAGVRLFLQGDAERFEDATAAAGAPVACVCQGAWAADVEMDGDLDIVLGVADGPAIVLRNNGDGSWLPLETFAALEHLQSFAWADIDQDGDPDAVALARDTVRVLLNRRAGAFAELALPDAARRAIALTVADVNADGVFDIVAEAAGGLVRQLSLDDRLEWTGSDVARLAPADAAPPDRAQPRVLWLAADMDNNGAIDLIRSAGSSQVFLASETFLFSPLATTVPARVLRVDDFDGDGRLDLTGIAPGAVRFTGQGTRPYHWKQIQVRAQSSAGDQRINPFAVGGEIEVRAGLLRQKQLLSGAVAHFGLGTRSSIDVARIVWPNGVPQAEFGAEVDDVIVAEQRLKGSCPWVFADDGHGPRFVTDFIWRSPLGLRINAQDTAGVNQTEDWVRIAGSQLKARAGKYDVRITAELWETHFFDHVSLMVVDHPSGTEMFVDERFRPGRTVTFAPQAVRGLEPVMNVVDDRGRDATELVAQADGRHASMFERGRFQGIAAEHYLEFDAPETAPDTSGGHQILVARGWVYPTDSSINVAVGQGRHDQPRALSLEARDDTGRWFVADPDLGFPAGKNKTMLIDLRPARGATRLRLRTNMEVSWDALSIAWTADAPFRTTRLATTRADLRYRGFSSTTSWRGDAPETPSYAPVSGVAQRWLDLEGYYTRFGEVGELLTAVDDRYVIMNAGDELAMEFDAPVEPGAGWTRDFILIGDGWEKDGDFNTEHSRTVLPLPAHGAVPYTTAAGALEDDPVYRRHPSDWERYHTRYVTPARFTRGLGGLRSGAAAARAPNHASQDPSR